MTSLQKLTSWPQNVYGKLNNPNSQNNLEKEEQSWRAQTFLISKLTTSYSNQDGVD